MGGERTGDGGEGEGRERTGEGRGGGGQERMGDGGEEKSIGTLIGKSTVYFIIFLHF